METVLASKLTALLERTRALQVGWRRTTRKVQTHYVKRVYFDGYKSIEDDEQRLLDPIGMTFIVNLFFFRDCSENLKLAHGEALLSKSE